MERSGLLYELAKPPHRALRVGGEKRSVKGLGESGPRVKGRAAKRQDRRDADEVLHDAQVAAKAQLDQAAAHATAQRRNADEDVRHMHDRARTEVAAMRAAAEAELDDLAAQRDAIAEQLHGLQGGLASVTALLGAPGPRSRERAAP